MYIYIYIYLYMYIYILVVLSDPRHTEHRVFKSHNSKMSVIYMKS